MVDALSIAATGVAPGLGGAGAASKSPEPGFFGTLNQALTDVSAAQGQATAAEAGYAAGVPGATLAKALVANDHAAVAWNATVAVRNELVAAYQSVMNMQF